MASTQDALQPVVSARTLTVKLLRALESVGVARKSLTMERSRESGRAAPISGKGLNSAIHEINNPLESLLNLLYLVENDSALSPESRNHLRMAQAEVMRVSRIAQATMKRSRHAEPAKEADVAALLASVVELHKNKLDRHKVSVSARGDHETTIIVHPEQMRQVFSNLLLNAWMPCPRVEPFPQRFQKPTNGVERSVMGCESRSRIPEQEYPARSFRTYVSLSSPPRAPLATAWDWPSFTRS
jgi:signal transduction histidine kinase